MNRKKLCSLLAVTVACANLVPAWGLTPVQNSQIEGNSIVIGNHLFELDTNGADFTLERFMDAIRSIEAGEKNAIFYKDYKGNWYELVEDSSLTHTIDVEQIKNNLEHIFGTLDKEASKVLLQTHISIAPTGFKESHKVPGTFENKVLVTLSNQTTATFKDFEGGAVDTISGASTVGTVPKGLTLEMNRISDKQIELTLLGQAIVHNEEINTITDITDYNGNNIFGDIKLLMLPELFENVESVELDGVYAVTDVLYTDDVVAEGEILNPNTQKILNIEQVHYGVLELQQGTLNDYIVRLNGEVITPTPVDNRATLFKFEINPTQVAQVQITSKNNPDLTQTINLGTGKEAFTGVIQDEDPIRILTSGPVSYFDYFLDNYDKDGNVRIQPTKATFNLVNEGVEEVDKTLPLLSSQPTVVDEDIAITFDGTTPEGKQWQENVYEVLVDYGRGENTGVPVQFEVSNGVIKIKAESTALKDRNGKHNLIIKSNGYNNAKVTIEIVREAGNVMLSGDFGPWAHQDLLFELYDFNYAITNPIYEVVLDGVTLRGDCVDYHVISNLVRLENECLDKLTVGKHTLVVKAWGYKDFTKTFVLEEAPLGEQNPTYGDSEHEVYKVDYSTEAVTLDAVSAASSGSSSSGDTSGDGSGTIRANIIFDFDLIANAKILNALNRATPYAEEVIEWWYALTKDAVITPDGEDKLISYEYFKNYANLQPEGYVTFKDLYESIPKQDDDMMTPEHPGIYLNRPYNVKNMLEDGLLGEVYAYFESSAKASPKLEVKEVYYGDDIIINYEDIAEVQKWEEAIQQVVVGTNYLQYTIDPVNYRLIIPTVGNSIAYGTNTISVQADGYTTGKVQVEVHKRNESVLEVSKDGEGNIYISGLTESFAKGITGLSIDGKALFNDRQVGANQGDYELNGQVITLREKLFATSNGTQKTLKIVAHGYNDVYVQFTPNKVEDAGEEKLAEVPAFVGLSLTNSYEVGEDILLVVRELGTGVGYPLEQVYVNDTPVEDKGNTGYAEFSIDGSFFNELGKYTIKLCAKGYKDKIIEVNIQEKNNAKDVPDYVQVRKPEVEIGNAIEVSLGSFMNTEYIKAFTKIVVDEDKTYIRQDLGVTDYTSSVRLLDLGVGRHSLKLYAEGYKTKEIEVHVKLKQVPSTVQMRIDEETMTSDQVTITTDAAIKVVVGKEDYSRPTYLEELDTLTVDDKVFKKSDLEILEERLGFFDSIKYVQIDPALLPEGIHTICLKANNYEDKIFTIIINKKQ